MSERPTSSPRPGLALICVPGLSVAHIPMDRFAGPDRFAAPMTVRPTATAAALAMTVATGLPAWRHGATVSAVWDETLRCVRPLRPGDLPTRTVWEIAGELGVVVRAVGWFEDPAESNPPREPTRGEVAAALGSRVAGAIGGVGPDRRAAHRAVRSLARLLGIHRGLINALNGAPGSVAIACYAPAAELANHPLVDQAKLSASIGAMVAQVAGLLPGPARLLVCGGPCVSDAWTDRAPAPGGVAPSGFLLGVGIPSSHAPAGVRDIDIAPTVLGLLELGAAWDWPGEDRLAAAGRQPAPAAFSFGREPAGPSAHPEERSIRALTGLGYSEPATNGAPAAAAVRRRTTHAAFAAFSDGAFDRAARLLGSGPGRGASTPTVGERTVLAFAAFSRGAIDQAGEHLDALGALGLDTPLMAAARIGGGDTARAATELDRALARCDGPDPTWAFEHAGPTLALAAEHAGLVERAAELFGACATRLPDRPEAALGLARLAQRRGDHASAVVHGLDAIAIDRSHADAHGTIGRSLAALKQYREAAVALERSLQINSHQPDLRTLCAAVLRRCGEHRRAMRYDGEIGLVVPDDDGSSSR